MLQNAERRTQVPKAYLLSGFAFIYLALVSLNIGGIGELLANLASVALPCYFSLVALETPGRSDDTHYLTYWVVFAAFTLLEFWSSFILYWVPLYWLFKTVFFLYLGLPQFGGARYVYENFLRPLSVQFLGIRGGTVAHDVADRYKGHSTSIRH